MYVIHSCINAPSCDFLPIYTDSYPRILKKHWTSNRLPSDSASEQHSGSQSYQRLLTGFQGVSGSAGP